MLFGPAPATVAIAIDGFLLFVAARPPRPSASCSTPPTRRSASGSAAHAFMCWSTRGAAGPPVATVEAVALPLAVMAGLHFLVNSGFTAIAAALERGVSPFDGVAPALRGVLAEPRRVGVRRPVPAGAGPAARRRRPGRGDADGRHRLPRPALAVRPAGRRRAPRPAGRSALHVDDSGAVDRHRSQGRRDQQPHPPRADLFAGAGPRRGRHRSRHPQGDRGGLAAPRHRQAGRARAHPQQARQADPGRVRGDEAARRRRRRHPLVD